MKKYHENMKGILLVSEKLFDHLSERDEILEKLENELNVDRIRNSLIRKDRDIFLEENKRLREALKFYADEKTHEHKTLYKGSQVITGICPIIKDKGEIARIALEETK